MKHGRGKCEKVWHGVGGEYGHGAYDDSEYAVMITYETIFIYCGRCHRKIREERIRNADRE